MLSEYQLQTIDQAWVALVFLGLVSLLYWLDSRSLIKSAHGILAIFGFVYAVLVSEITEFDPHHIFYWPLHILIILSLASLAFSLKAFIKNKTIHAVHTLTLASIFLVWFAGTMAISHDWI